MAYVWDTNPIATAVGVAWNSIVQGGQATLAHLGAYLDSDYNAFWYPPAPVTPAALAAAAGTSLLGMLDTHYELGAIVIAQEAINGLDSSIHPWAIRQVGGGYAPGVPRGTLVIPTLDGSGNSTGAGSVVNQVLTTITLTPSTSTLAPGGTQAFTASGLDQFGNAMELPPTFAWAAVSGVIDQAGNYTAAATAGSDTVTVASGSVTATAAITIS